MNNFTVTDHNHNLKYNLAHEFFWGFGAAFHTLYAVVPLFLKQLNAPNYIIVSTAGIFSIAVAIPTLFSAAIGRNIINIKKSVIRVHCIILIVAFAMGFTFSALNSKIVNEAWGIYILYFILYAISIGIIVPIWADFLNKSTLKSERGKFFGIGFAFNSLGSFFGGIALKYLLLYDIEFPKNFGIGFFILFLSLLIATILFLPFKIKSLNKSKKDQTLNQFFREIVFIVKKHKNFQRYLISRVFFSANLPGLGLYAVYCQDKFKFDLSEAGIFTIITVITSGASSFVSGKIGDYYGHKKSMLVAYLGHLIAAIIAIYAWNMFGVYAIFIAIGVGQGAFMPSAMNFIYIFSSKSDAKKYMALIDTTLAPFIFAYVILIGWLISLSAYLLSIKILIASLAISIVILILLVKDPENEKVI